MTVIVDYGAGNLRSVQNALEELGASYLVTSGSRTVSRANKLILPGVGCFGQMMSALDKLGLREILTQRIYAGVPFLGICVGLQCLFEGSEESPESTGLAIFPGLVKRFAGNARIPHMGWNSLSPVQPCELTEGLPGDTFMYFAHSYYAPVTTATAAICTYIHPYSAILHDRNIYAVQFHPEKSGSAGLRVMKNFLDL
ncbi:MAG: imidazole glycerol phosphate synthase subunit HisH [Acidobacteriaceae bacterium]|nr:imidazole glycerol phosphate synthase subunit HisH [Acidobacteriaceae bacterium]MBV9781677.1 imidazole glycerol phosphate synthase subunit HisH [Acidobacteriaceae bacterium]